MMIEVFLFQLLREAGPHRIKFWITAAGYTLLLAAALTGKWHLFKKTGKTPWHSLVPVLNAYELYDLAWDRRFGIAEGILYLVIMFTLPASDIPPIRFWYWPALLAAFIAALLLSAVMKIKLSKSFGRSRIFAYGLLFAEGIFYCILAFSDCEYFGRTLRKYNPAAAEKEKAGERGKLSRQYMISLHRSRSTVALAASTLTFAFCLFAVAGGLIEDPSEITPERGNHLFKLFTVCSNFYAAVGAAMMIPYAVEGFRKKRFSYPKWVQLLQYSGAICTTLTMVFAVCLIYPAIGPRIAFGRMNFWLHVVCPIMTLILLFSVETNLHLSVNDSLLCLSPFYIYALIYITNVVLVGEENGGWRDIYRLTAFLPPAISTPLMFMLGLGIALLIRKLYNRVSLYRQKQMESLWGEDLTPIEIKIEVYGLGRYTGVHDEISNITVPFDIFYAFAKKYEVTPEELARAYNKGVIDGLAERDEVLKMRRRRFERLFGTPEKLRMDITGE